MIERKQTRVAGDKAGRADRIVQELTGLTRAQVRGLFDHQCVAINGKPADEAGKLVKAGDMVRVVYDRDRRYHERPAPRTHDFNIVFEDDYLIVVDKAAGVLTVPTGKREQDTLVHEIARYFSQGPVIRKRAAIVHRLDRDTSGLLVFAKSEAIAKQLKLQFAQRKPEREYIAIVAGHVEKDEGTVTSHLRTAPDLDQYSDESGSDEGKIAITHYKVLRRLKDATAVSVTLETGRRNQIRVHFSEMGHPVLGDTRYQSDLAKHEGWTVKRLALHATVLGFKHPITRAPMLFRSQPPSAFARFQKHEVTRYESIKREVVRDEGVKREGVRHENVKRESAGQESFKREGVRPESVKRESAGQERFNREAVRHENVKRESAGQESFKRVGVRHESLKSDASKRKALKRPKS